MDSSGKIVGGWTSWVPHGATTSAHGCNDLIPKDQERRRQAFEATGIELAIGQVASLRWQCLTDTVDPRGPKGGK